MTLAFVPAMTKQIKHRVDPQMRKRLQPLPVLRRPTAVSNSGEYRVIIIIKQPDSGASSRLLGLEAPPGLERGGSLKGRYECFSNCKHSPDSC